MDRKPEIESGCRRGINSGFGFNQCDVERYRPQFFSNLHRISNCHVGHSSSVNSPGNPWSQSSQCRPRYFVSVSVLSQLFTAHSNQRRVELASTQSNLHNATWYGWRNKYCIIPLRYYNDSTTLTRNSHTLLIACNLLKFLPKNPDKLVQNKLTRKWRAVASPRDAACE